MSEESTPRHGSRGWLALMGFSLATAAPDEARASGTSPGSSSSSSGSLTAMTEVVLSTPLEVPFQPNL